MVSLYLQVINKIKFTQGQVFNIGGGMENSLSILELLSVLERELDIELHYKTLPPRQSDQRVFIADITKAKNLFNWTPHTDKINGIRKMIDWISQT
jgi:CDP-paratose 2-epimerase